MKTRQCVLTQPDNMRPFHVLLGPYRTDCVLIRKYDFNMKEVKGRVSSFPLPFCIFQFPHLAAASPARLFVSNPISSPVCAFHVGLVPPETASPGELNCQVCTTANQ